MNISKIRNAIEKRYKKTPTGCGSSFGEILCFEIHINHLTFLDLAKKWNLTISTIGELIYDHCKRMPDASKKWDKLPAITLPKSIPLYNYLI